MWIRTFALALLIGAPFASGANPAFWSPDASLESTTTTLTAPLVEGSLLLAKSCDRCKSHPLRLTSQTLVFIGNRQVSIAEFNEFLKGGTVHNLGIFYDKTTQTITKLVVFARSPSRPAASRS